MIGVEIFLGICLLMTFYPYIIYPLLVAFWSRVVGRPWRRGDDEQVRVSLIISVYNEEDVIQQKLENALALDYPSEYLEVVVVSDGSTDATEEIVSSCIDPRVVLKSYERVGKTACLNRAVMEAHGDIIVFTDANSMFPPDTLKKIIRNFPDEEIGLVTGWTKYCRRNKPGEDATGVYGRLEKYTKTWESRISSCVGADGAIFAIRRELYSPLDDRDINDLVIPLRVLGQGRRVVLDAEVYCIEEPSEGVVEEFRRQSRITNRTLGAISRNAQFLFPWRYGIFAFFLFSHKVLRLMVPIFGGMSLLAVLILSLTSLIYKIVFGVIGVFVLAGVIGLLNLVHSRFVNICATFLLTNAGQALGWFRFLTGRGDTLWIPQR